MVKKNLTLTFEEASLLDIEKYKRFILDLFANGVPNIRSGQAVLHFDHDGTLQEIDINVKKWRKKYPQPLQDFYKNVKMIAETQLS